jgi:hypothetical protein
MRFLQRFAQGELHLTRLEAFSDAVFASIVTRLALELKVPERHNWRDVSAPGEYADNKLAVSLFGVVMAINTLLFMALQACITSHRITPELVGAPGPHFLRNGLAGAAAAWIGIPIVFLIYRLTPLFYLTPPLLRGVAHPNLARPDPTRDALQLAPR